MQTHSITLSVQVNFQYDNDKVEHKQAIRDALDLAFNPNFHSLCCGTRITGVKVSDLEGAGELISYGED